MAQRSYDPEKIHEALVNAFDDASLTQMVYFKLHVHLSDIARENGNFRQRTFDLVVWAERMNRLDDLVAGAYAANPGNPLLQNLRNPNGQAPQAISGQPYLTRQGVAASGSEETAALARRIGEWKDLHHAVQELLLVIQETDRLLATLLLLPTLAAGSTTVTDALDRLWIKDTSKKVAVLKECLSSFTLIAGEQVVTDLAEVIMRTGERSLAWALLGVDVADRAKVKQVATLVVEVQGVLVDALRASDDWIRQLVGQLSARLGSGGSN